MGPQTTDRKSAAIPSLQRFCPLELLLPLLLYESVLSPIKIRGFGPGFEGGGVEALAKTVSAGVQSCQWRSQEVAAGPTPKSSHMAGATAAAAAGAELIGNGTWWSSPRCDI